MHFGVFLTRIDPALRSIADLQRCRHIEPYLSAQVDAINTVAVVSLVPEPARGPFTCFTSLFVPSVAALETPPVSK